MIQFENSYAQLPKEFFSRQRPEKTTPATLLAFNKNLAQELQIDFENKSTQELLSIFSGQHILETSDPIAMVYAGHQFGGFSPLLGDGRAILLGEVLSKNGIRYDIQLKGSGKTIFSRRGDGKSQLGPVLREYIVSEALHHLGLSTTRSLAAVQTTDKIVRQTLQPGALLTRVAKSHTRIGTFEYFTAKQDLANLKILADYSIHRLYPHISESSDKYLLFLRNVINNQIQLVSDWMSVGFIHGVMNTDNCSISGETLDFGPCAFLDEFKWGKVFSSIDHGGRYAYGNQPQALFWNLCRFAECLIPLIHTDDTKVAVQKVESVLSEYNSLFESTLLNKMSKKLGFTTGTDASSKILQNWLKLMETKEWDFTLSFRHLSDTLAPNSASQHFTSDEDFTNWHQSWKQSVLTQKLMPSQITESMDQVNPIYIPRNHHIEKAIVQACEGDLSIFQDLLEVIQNPYHKQDRYQEYKQPPKVQERVTATFCGT